MQFPVTAQRELIDYNIVEVLQGGGDYLPLRSLGLE